MPKELRAAFPIDSVVRVPNCIEPTPKGRKSILGRITSSQMTIKKDGYIYMIWFAPYVLHDQQTEEEEVLYNSKEINIKLVRAATTATIPKHKGAKELASVVPESVASRRSGRIQVIQCFHCICLCYITFCSRGCCKNPQQNMQKCQKR